jgi:acetoacetyl-CoA synthetase
MLGGRVEDSKQPLWRPTHAEESGLYAFCRAAEVKSASAFPDYDSLWRWSVSSSEAFWALAWEQLGVIGERGERILMEGSRTPGARWSPDARLNFAENLLRDSANDEALVFWGEDKIKRRLSRSELRHQVARMAAALRALSRIRRSSTRFHP